MGEEWGRSHRWPFQWTGQEHVRTTLTSWLRITTGFALGGVVSLQRVAISGGAQVTRRCRGYNLFMQTEPVLSLQQNGGPRHLISTASCTVTETGLRCGSFLFYFDQTLNFQSINWFHTTRDPDLPPPTRPLQEENPCQPHCQLCHTGGAPGLTVGSTPEG